MSAAPEPAPGDLVVPGYQILDRVAQISLCSVFRARDLTLNCDVAIKFSHPFGAAERLAHEARVMVQLAHPGIVPVHRFGVLPDGRPFLVMKLIKGQTLAQLLREPVRPDGHRRLLAVFEQACQTIAFAHSRGVIHRNLKPSEVMIGAFGEVLILGWNLSRLSAEPVADPEATPPLVNETDSPSHQVVGTPAYMPPEQARGEPADTRSDVFGLGGILCTILTSAPPFPPADAISDLLRRVAAGDLTETFARLDACGADTDLIALAKKCLSPNRDERPADASALAALVAEYRARNETPRPHADRSRHRFRVAILAFLLVAVVLLFVNAIALWWPR